LNSRCRVRTETPNCAARSDTRVIPAAPVADSMSVEMSSPRVGSAGHRSTRKSVTHRGIDERSETGRSKQQPEHPALALKLPLKVACHHAGEHRSSVRLEDQNGRRRSDEGLFEAGGESGMSRTYASGMDHRIGLLESMLDKTGDVVLAVNPDQHDLPTPCADFDVAELLEHIALWIQVFDSAVNNKELGFDPNDHHIAADWHRIIVDAAKSIVLGLKDHGVDRQMTMTSAPMPGEFILNMLLMEYVGHSWDLTRACGIDTPHDELEAAAALAAATAIVLPEHRDSPMFAQAFEVPPNAPAIERFVAFLGRDPAWSPRQ